MTLLDVTRTDDRHTSGRLSAEPIIWLGTVRPDGRPRNVPVWFAWHDPMVLIFSMPKTAKVRDVRLSPAVSLALDSADGGQDIVLAEGRAELIAGAERHPHFLAEKFREPTCELLRRLLVAVLLHGDRPALVRNLDEALLGVAGADASLQQRAS